MNNDLDDLKTMMDDTTPRPDAARRAENLALAQKNFADLQGSRAAARPTSVTRPKGLWTGVKTMLNTITTKGGLTATTALVACGFLVMTPQGQDLLRPPSAPQITMTEFDGVIEAPRIERGPLTDSDLSPDMLSREPLSEPFGDVLQEPLVVPDAEVALVPQVPAQPPKVAPQTGQSETANTIVGEENRTMPQPEEFASETAIASEDAEVAPTTSVRPQIRGRTVQNIDDLAEPAPFPDPTGQELFGRWSSYGLDEGIANRPRETNQPDPQVGQEILNLLDDLLDETSTQPKTETFANADTNPLQITGETPVSTFSIDVDTASYSVLRSSLSRGQLPSTQSVRIEELINYFPYAYPAPDAGEAPFRPTVTTFQTPWNADTQLVHIALQGQMPAVDDRPPLNLVFLIDTSGSMNDPTKLPLLKQSFRLMLDQLRPEDEVAIVEYAGSAGQVLAPTAASDRTTILQAIQSLGAGGSTNGQGGLEQAYSVADAMRADGEVNRVILATDGDFNVGLSNPDALKDFIADKRDTGTYLSVLGFGRGNLDDATMQALAQNGNGTAAYIDTLSEAQKVLVDQLSGALFPIAGDVKVQVEFNPAQIAEYRLIGYETRALNREDFNNDAVDAGELGAGHSVTAIYEVTPVGSPAQLSDPLRYAPNTVAATSDELGFLKLRYKEPGESVSRLIETQIVGNSIPGTEANFAAAIAGFGQLLRNPQYLGDWGYDEAIALANVNRGTDDFGYRTEAVQLMRLAQSLSQ